MRPCLLKSRQFWQRSQTATLLCLLPTIALGVSSQPATLSAVVGQWSAPFNTQVVPIHMSMGCNGKVLMWQRTKLAPSGPRSIVWNQPSTTSFTTVPAVNTDIFCAGHDLAPSGRLLVAGGHSSTTSGDGSKDINVYDFEGNTWTQYPNKMIEGRWYPSLAYNANGEGVIFSGTLRDTVTNRTPQVWGTNGSADVRSLTGVSLSLDVQPYNWMFLAPNGKMFIAGPFRDTHMLDTTGNGSSIPGDISSQNRFYGATVFSNVGKVMIIGGSAADAYGDPVNTVEAIDLNATFPNWLFLNQMTNARRHHNATLLADGNVLVPPVTSLGSFNNTSGTVLAAEMWNQSTGGWSTMASQSVRRTYHSTALLLPTGQVASCGGGLPLGNGTAADLDTTTQGNYNCEIYSPPYLFKGTRLTISSAPTQINYNTNFTVSTPNANDIAKVSWIRLSSVTHGYNVGQRFAQLSFTKTSSGLTIVAPKTKANVPAGCYMLFILNNNGVPSQAKIIKIS